MSHTDILLHIQMSHHSQISIRDIPGQRQVGECAVSIPVIVAVTAGRNSIITAKSSLSTVISRFDSRIIEYVILEILSTEFMCSDGCPLSVGLQWEYLGSIGSE